MKINWRNPSHILWFSLSAVAIALSCPFALLPRRSKSIKRIIVTGHKLNGNLWAFYRFIAQREGYECEFLSMDLGYYRKLKADHYKVLFFGNPLAMIKVARSAIIISDHGPGLLAIFAPSRFPKLVDVWHGVPFKGYVAADFKSLRSVDEVWLTSDFLAKVYVEKFGFRAEQVRVTGYARTDVLVNGQSDERAIYRDLRIENKFAKVVTFAPTWQQDSAGREIIPFGMNGEEFFTGLDELAKRHGAVIIFRAHLNDSVRIDSNYPNICIRSHAEHVITEETLAITDILVTDWSSIAFDFLVTKRPTLFLNVPPPFKNGFTFAEQYRAGPIIDSFAQLLETLEGYIVHPNSYIEEFEKSIKFATGDVFGTNADGRSSERYFLAVEELTR